MNAENEKSSSEDNNIPDEKDIRTGDPGAGSSRSGRIAFVLIFLLAVTALFLSVGNFRTIEDLTNRTDISEILERHASQVRDANDRLDSLRLQQAEFDNRLSGLAEQQSDNAAALQRLFESQRSDSVDWTVAEIEHLMLIAVHRLSLERDVSTALAALQAADDRLARIAEPVLFETRRQLAADMNALRSVSRIDIPGNSLYLADMVKRIENLPLKEILPPEEYSGTADDYDEQPAWKRLISAVWKEIKGMVIITRTGSIASVNLLPDERYFLYQNLRLQMETARLALIRRDPENFRISLGIVTSWLRDYFDTDDSRVVDIIDRVEVMRNLDLDPALPDIHGSLASLRAYIRGRSAKGGTAAETLIQ